MTKAVVVIEPAPDAPGILHVDTDRGKFGPIPTHDVGHEAHESERVDTIRRLAYAMWEARGGAHGLSEMDWLAAEREVLGLHGNSAGTGNVGEDGVVNPGDGRGPLRTSDDQAYDRPLAKVI